MNEVKENILYSSEWDDINSYWILLNDKILISDMNHHQISYLYTPCSLGDQVLLHNATQSTTGYASTPASNALTDGNGYGETKQGVGQWWQAEFDQERTIVKIEIQNLIHNCCGWNLGLTNVFVGD